MKIAIIGYGKMGKEIETQAQNMRIPVSRIIHRKDHLSQILFEPDEVAVEFTTPDACVANIQTLLKKNVPVVCGTTGWNGKLNEVKSIVKETNGAFLHASNFSIGVHLFWKTLEQLSKKINATQGHSVRISETHHVHKKDKPSGTAKSTASIIEQNAPRMGKVEIESVREGEVFGDHHVYFESATDTIELSHKAKSRAGFARGAIDCAKWLHGKKGFFTIENYLQEKLK